MDGSKRGGGKATRVNALILLLLSFVVLGLLRDRLGRATYAWMGVCIIVYVAYADYVHP